jgi:phage portal protein BeeE
VGVRDFLARRSRSEPLANQRAVSWGYYQELFKNLGNTYSAQVNQTMPGEGREKIAGNFSSIVQGAYKDNGVVFACILARMLLFAEARFQLRQFDKGRPGNLFGDPGLLPLEKPWPGGTTGDLLAKAEQDVSLAGNHFIVRTGTTLKRLRPDWVTIVSGSRREDASMWDIDAEVLGYLYQPGGPSQGRRQEFLPAERVAHYAPIPDPTAPWRGMSWLQSVLPEVDADGAATAHKFKFFENGATVNLFVKFPDPVDTVGSFQEWVAAFNEEHQGVMNAYKTLFMGGVGADAKPVGSDFRQMEFKATQGAGETRIAAAAGVPPIIVGLSEGLASATYSNYAQARRRFVDLTMRPLWRNFAASVQPILDIPSRAHLWYDDRDVPALREDEKEKAEIQVAQASAIKQLVEAGFEPKATINAITSGELSKLEHTGLMSVQMRPPGEGTTNGHVPQNGENGRVPVLAPAQEEN